MEERKRSEKISTEVSHSHFSLFIYQIAMRIKFKPILYYMC